MAYGNHIEISFIARVRLYVTLLFAVMAALCAVPFACPAPAHATYADIADSYGTIEDIQPKGDPIIASSIPDYKYKGLEVRTSSSFCAVNNCSIVVSGGQMSVTFVLTKTYNAVYLGTAEEAASLTDAAGEDHSAYYMATETELGNQFTIPLSALNECIDLATFNGGNKSLSKAKWYDRKAIFDSTSEIILAVQSGKAPGSGSSEGDDSGSGEDKDKDKDKDSGKDKSSDKSDTSDSESDSSSASQSGDSSTDTDSDSSSDDKTKSDDASKSKDDKKAGAAGTAGSKSGSSGSSGGKTAADPKPSAETEKAAAAASKATGHNVVPGTPIEYLVPDIEPEELEAAVAQARAEEAANTANYAALAFAASLVALVMAGIVARMALYIRGLRVARAL